MKEGLIYFLAAAAVLALSIWFLFFSKVGLALVLLVMIFMSFYSRSESIKMFIKDTEQMLGDYTEDFKTVKETGDEEMERQVGLKLWQDDRFKKFLFLICLMVLYLIALPVYMLFFAVSGIYPLLCVLVVLFIFILPVAIGKERRKTEGFKLYSKFTSFYTSFVLFLLLFNALNIL